ncbi:hypothetical protein L249_5598, partial [Ophiocordyceps polyrhachis-furcata BCC 54312]
MSCPHPDQKRPSQALPVSRPTDRGEGEIWSEQGDGRGHLVVARWSRESCTHLRQRDQFINQTYIDCYKTGSPWKRIQNTDQTDSPFHRPQTNQVRPGSNLPAQRRDSHVA